MSRSISARPASRANGGSSSSATRASTRIGPIRSAGPFRSRGRAVSSLIQTQGVGDLYRIYATTQRDGVDFNLAFIPATFNVPLNEPFDQHYMVELFKLGYELGRSGYDWVKVPPGY